MTDVILCAASNLFRMYVISRFMKVLLGEPRVSRGTLLSVYGIFYAVNTALYLLLPLSWVNLLCNLAGLSFLAFFYTRSARSICFAVVSYAVIGMACEYILMALFADNEGGKTLPKDFLKIHQSYLVHTLFVARYAYDEVELTDGTILSISKKYRKQVRERLLRGGEEI